MPPLRVGHQWDFSVDIWSVGCIMAEMITGKILFKGNDRILLSRASFDFGQDVGAGWAPSASALYS